MASLEERPHGLTGLGGFGRHHWPVTLQHGRVILAPLRHRDRAAWERVRRENASWLRPWEATLPPGSQIGPSTYAGLVRSVTRQAREGRMLPWLVFYDGESDRSRPQLAGQLTVSGIVGGSASWGQIGYWIDERLAGRGIIPTAVALAVDYCFHVMSLHRIEIAIRPENTNSLRVVEKLGLREVGFAPKFLHIDGAWRDHRIYAITVEECPDGMRARLC
jgi:ribosomal-protein-alanine N-acetyltransferase